MVPGLVGIARVCHDPLFVCEALNIALKGGLAQMMLLSAYIIHVFEICIVIYIYICCVRCVYVSSNYILSNMSL